jgi:hypothetical protein
LCEFGNTRPECETFKGLVEDDDDEEGNVGRVSSDDEGDTDD